jgi:hypothetical protein
VRALLVVALLTASPALPLSREAQEFMEVTKKLEPVQCEKRRLRREIALAEAERRDGDARSLRKKFALLNKDAETARLEKRLAQLEPRLASSKDAEDLEAINRQRVQAFYRCE